MGGDPTRGSWAVGNRPAGSVGGILGHVGERHKPSLQPGKPAQSIIEMSRWGWGLGGGGETHRSGGFEVLSSCIPPAPSSRRWGSQTQAGYTG